MFIVINKLAAVNNEIIKCNDEPDEVYKSDKTKKYYFVIFVIK